MSKQTELIRRAALALSRLNRPVFLPIGPRPGRWVPAFNGQVNYNPGREHFMDQILQEIAQTTRKPLLIDVGANIGQTIAQFSAAIPGCRIISFEPNPSCAAYLVEFLRRNPELDVALFSTALGASPGVVTLTLMGADDLYSQRASTASQGRPGWLEREICRVAQTTLDLIAQTTPFDGLAAIKIDVEGAEVDVLRGAVGVLETYRPLIMFEVLPAFLFVEKIRLPQAVIDQRQRRAHEIVEILTGLGYRLTQNTGSAFVDIHAIDVQAIQTPEQTAFVARA